MLLSDEITQRFSEFAFQLTHESTRGSTAERKYLIEFGLNIFQDKPLAGYGLATFSYLNPFHKYAHNNFVEILVGVGLIGTLLFYSMHYFIGKQIFKMKDKSLKTIFIYFLFILFFMDLAIVSYGNKLILLILLFIAIVAEEDSDCEEEQNR